MQQHKLKAALKHTQYFYNTLKVRGEKKGMHDIPFAVQRLFTIQNIQVYLISLNALMCFILLLFSYKVVQEKIKPSHNEAILSVCEQPQYT